MNFTSKYDMSVNEINPYNGSPTGYGSLQTSLDPIDVFAGGLYIGVEAFTAEGFALGVEKNVGLYIEDASQSAKTTLEGAVKDNYSRFVSKIPANSKASASFELMEDENYLFKATSPGQVPG